MTAVPSSFIIFVLTDGVIFRCSSNDDPGERETGRILRATVHSSGFSTVRATIIVFSISKRRLQSLLVSSREGKLESGGTVMA
jgi:hypothetical protein